MSDALAKVFVYSMFLDGPIRSETQANVDESAQQSGFLAGSHALDSLDKLITSTESYFHPSNYGHWTLAASSFIVYLVRVWLTIITADELLATLVCGIHQTLERGAAANLQDPSGKRVLVWSLPSDVIESPRLVV